MSSIKFIYVCFLILLPITVQHQCVQFCFVSLKFDEKFDTLPSTCNRTYQNVECYTHINFDYASELIEITFGEQSINNSSLIPDDYYVSQKTELWHDTYNIQGTIFQHKCYHGDLCDFEYAKRKVFEMSKLTTNFAQFQQKLSAALLTPDSGSSIIRCSSTDGRIVTCGENIKSCNVTIDNVYGNKTQRGCSSPSDDQLRKQLGIVEETSYYRNGKVDVQQSSMGYVCNHELCNGPNTYKQVVQLLMEYNLMRNGTPIEPPFSASNIKRPVHKILLIIPLIFHFIFYQ